MMKFSIINQKGGVGKTTISINLAYGLALAGRKVLLIDLDHQANTSAIYCNENEAENKHLTVAELFKQKNQLGIRELIRPAKVLGKEVDNLSIIPSDINLAPEAERAISRLYREKILAKHLQAIENDYDYVLVDSPPAINTLTVNSIYLADFILIPVSIGSRYSLDGIVALFDLIDSIKEDDYYDYRIIKNEQDIRNKRSMSYTDTQLEALQGNIAETIINKAEAIRHSQAEGQPIYTFDPKSKGVEDFNKLTNEVISYVEG